MSDIKNIGDPIYIRIATSIVRRVTGTLPFDIYIQRTENKFTKIFVKDNLVDKDLVNHYGSEKKVDYFFVHNTEKQTYNYYVERLLESSLANPQVLTPGEVTSVLNEMVSITLNEIHENHHIEMKSIKWAETTIKACTQMLSSDFQGMCKILKSLSSRPHAMKHSMMVSVFSILLARSLGHEGSKTMNILGLGGFLHDVGMSRLNPDLIYKEDLTSDEFKEIKQHTHLGARILDTIRSIPSEVRTVVLQHHEQPNGMGYPNGIRGHEIFQPAKIVAVADVFTTLITTSPYRDHAFKAFEALKIMAEESGRFDVDVLKSFTTIFSGHLAKDSTAADSKNPKYMN